MMGLSIFLYTSVLDKKVYDEFGDVLGCLRDVYVTTEGGYPRVIGYKVKRDGITFHYEFRYIEFTNKDGKFKIKTQKIKNGTQIRLYAKNKYKQKSKVNTVVVYWKLF